MKYQEMLDSLSQLTEVERQSSIVEHWQTVFSDGFIGFVQGQIEAARTAIQPGSQARQLLTSSNIPEELIVPYFEQNLEKAITVWESMRSTYSMLQQRSQRQGSSGGMVEHGRHQAMPAGVTISGAVNCYRCGAPVQANGLCGSCLSTQEEWDREDLEYDRQLHDQQLERLEYQRIQDEHIYHDTQLDFNTYEDY